MQLQSSIKYRRLNWNQIVIDDRIWTVWNLNLRWGDSGGLIALAYKTETNWIPISVLASINAIWAFFVVLHLWNPFSTIIDWIFIGNSILSRALGNLCPDYFGRFTIARFFTYLPDNGIPDNPVNPIVQVTSEAVRWVAVIPLLHPDIGHDCFFYPVPPCVHARDSKVIYKRIFNNVHTSPLWGKNKTNLRTVSWRAQKWLRKNCNHVHTSALWAKNVRQISLLIPSRHQEFSRVIILQKMHDFDSLKMLLEQTCHLL